MELLFATAAVAFTAGYIDRGEIGGRDQPGQVEQYLDEHRVELQERYETTRMDYIEFETMRELRGADREDLVAVHGVASPSRTHQAPTRRRATDSRILTNHVTVFR